MTSALVDVVAQAGWVGVVLVLVSLLMWTGVAQRAAVLRRGFRGSLERLVDAALAEPPQSAHTLGRRPLGWFVAEAAHVARSHAAAPERLDSLAGRASQQLGFGRVVLRALVVAAPLLGLLGTVDGMIETFGSLHGGVLALSDRGSVAGGISTALISTQLGLGIGIPGLIVARALEAIEHRRRRQIFQARALVAQRMMER